MLTRIRESIGLIGFSVVIGLIAIAFVFWGVDLNLAGATYAARVNGEEISFSEFEREFQNELWQYQELYRIDLDEAFRREIRRGVLERMVGTRALRQHVDEAGYRVADDRVARHILSMPAFQVDGQFSMDIYRAQLRFQGLSPAQFEDMQRLQLSLTDLRDGLVESNFLTPAEFRRFIELYGQEREIGYAVFEAAAFLDQVEITAEEIEQHYEINRSAYRSEEMVDIEYIELRQADLEPEVEVTEEALRSYYERERGRFERVEERRARHILVTVRPGEDEAARARAADIVERIEAGEDFETLAREISDDPGTRAQGGDLGWLTEGLLGGELDEAIFETEVGAVRGPVRTDFGYHVVRVDDVRAGDVQPFEALEEELREEFLADRLEALFVNRANELADRAYDAFDDLASVAAQMDLPLRTAEGFPRSGDPELFANSAAVVRAAFGREQLENRLNSALVELSPTHVLVLRVTDHHPPQELPLESVRDQIEEELRQRRAEELAQAAASNFQAELEAVVSETRGAADGAGEAVPGDAGTGEADEGEAPGGDAQAEPAVAEAEGDEEAGEAAGEEAAPAPEQALAEAHGGRWNSVRWVGRDMPGVPTQVLSAAFRLPRPAEGDVALERVFLATGDQAVLRLSGVRPGVPAAVPQEERDELQRELVEQTALMDVAAYAESIRNQARVRIPPDVLDDPDVFF